MVQHNQNPPIFIGIIGASVALWISKMFPLAEFVLTVLGRILLAVVSIWILSALGTVLVHRVQAWHTGLDWYNRPESKIASLYYRYRVKVLTALGLIGR